MHSVVHVNLHCRVASSHLHRPRANVERDVHFKKELDFLIYMRRLAAGVKPCLSFFEQTPQVWSLPPEQLRDGLLTLGEVLTPALEVVIENHVDTADPMVIEGDAILPALISRPTVQTRASHGQIQAVFLVEPEEDALLAHMDARYRRSVQYQATDLQAMAHVRWLHGCWLAEEARRYQLPVVQSRPWETLAQRIVAVLT